MALKIGRWKAFRRGHGITGWGVRTLSGVIWLPCHGSTDKAEDRRMQADPWGTRLRRMALLVEAAPDMFAALEDIARQPEGDEESAQAVAREALRNIRSKWA